MMTDKQKTILQATLELVAEYGLTGTTIALIAKRAQASPGIIYHYFASKDEIIATLYAQIETDFVEALLAEQVLGLPWSERMPRLFLKTFDHFVEHPLALSFHEQYKNSAYHKIDDETAGDGVMAPLARALQDDIAHGLIRDWPLHVIYAMTAGVAISLARVQHAGVVTLSRTMLESIAAACCHSIQA